MSLNKRSWLLVVAAGLAATVLAAAVGFVVGRRWPLEGLEQRLGLRETPPPEPVGWIEFATTDLPRYEVVKGTAGPMLYLFGGFHSPETLATSRVETLNLETGTWSRKTDMPVPVTHANAVLLRDTFWIAGGFDGDHPGPATNRIWRYAVATDAWSEGPPLPELRGSGALVPWGDTLHYFGGYQTDRRTNSPSHWTLTPGDSAWRSAPPLDRPRGHISGVATDSAIYAISGTLSHDPAPQDVRWLDRFDPFTGVWTRGPDAPFSTSHTEPATVRYDDGFLTAGGRAAEEGRGTTADILRYSTSARRWLHVGRTPIPMLAGLAAVHRDTLFVGMGAEFGNTPRNPLMWKRALRDHWWEGQDMPWPLGEVSAGVIDGVLYVLGEGAPNTMAFDVAAGRWAVPMATAARPARGHHHAAEVAAGRLYLLGGLEDDSPGLVQIYDPQENIWSLGPPMPFAAGSSASATIDGAIYVAGGIVHDTTTSQAAALDLAAMAWRPIAPMPRPRNHAASATDGVRLYVFGGRGPGSGDGNVVANGFDDVQIYDPATDRWTVSDGSPGAPPPLPTARGGTGKAVYLDGEFWIMGGETADGPGANDAGTYDRVDIYDPRARTWRAGPPLRTARHGIFPVADAGRILIAGGGTRAGFSSSAGLEILWPRSTGARSPADSGSADGF